MNLVLEIIARKRCRMFRMGLARIASQNNNFNFLCSASSPRSCAAVSFCSAQRRKR